MVAGKVRLAMGFQKSPKHETPSSGNNNAPKKAVFFSRSFGVYFPRSSSSQVQPRPPDDVTELLLLIEELRERESRLKTEILEQKLLKETAAIVPVLENDIVLKDAELKRASEEFEFLRNENEMLKREVEDLKGKIEEEKDMNEMLKREVEDLKGKIEEEKDMNEMLKTEVEDLKGKIEEEKDMNEKRMRKMEEEITGMKKTVSFCSSDRRGKSNVIENLNNKCSGTRRAFAFGTNLNKEKVERLDFKTEELETQCNSEELVESAVVDIRSRVPRVPKPPPRPSSSSSPPPLPRLSAQPEVVKQVGPPPPPPPAPPSIKAFAPPPPPPPQKGTTRTIATKVRRIPEVVEFYHSLMRRDSKRETGGGCSSAPEVLPSTANSRDMIGEIENRSTHLLAIKTDVETQGDFIRFLIKEVENAVFTDIEDVVPFVKWLDNELSYLVDERAVLKHFNWPEQKADALREAAFGYCDLKKLESDASLFRDDPGQPCPPVLKKMQALLEKLEHGVYSLSRMRESASNRFKGFQIPMDWMLETGIVCQIKLASFKLAMKYMRRVSAELEAVGGGPEEKELIVQGVRFAFRVHQFAGGFDVETMRAFQELRDKAMSCHV